MQAGATDGFLTGCRFVDINTYWDRTSKVIILIVDAGLNYYFLRTVKQRLVKYHGLTKYAPLVTFNAKLMAVSIAMDVSPILPCILLYFSPLLLDIN
jgi:hypothetical protein